MYLNIYNKYFTTHDLTVPAETFELFTKAIVLPYEHITDNLITDFKNTKGEWVASIGTANNQKITQTAKLYNNMMQRCKAGGSKQRNQPAYIGCSVSENFSNFQYFCNWVHKQAGFGLEGWQLEKDLLGKGKKIYSEDTCCFVPRAINSLLITHRDRRGPLPLGVSAYTGRYKAQCSNGAGKTIYLGIFDTPRKAHNAYKKYKLQLIKGIAEEYKDQIDTRAYQALVNYKITISD